MLYEFFQCISERQFFTLGFKSERQGGTEHEGRLLAAGQDLGLPAQGVACRRGGWCGRAPVEGADGYDAWTDRFQRIQTPTSTYDL